MMTSTPNNADELLKMNEQPRTPYNRPVVQEVMDLLENDERTNMGDFQAVAELCIDLMKTVAASDLERHSDHCSVAGTIREALWNLESAEHFLEAAPFISMNVEAE